MNNYQLNIHKNLGDKVEVDLAKKQGEGDQKVFCSPSSGLPNPRRLTSATPIRGISRPGAVPSGLFSRPLFFFTAM